MLGEVLDKLDAGPKWLASKIYPYVPEWYKRRGIQNHSIFNVVGDVFVIASGGIAAQSQLEGVARSAGATGGLVAAVIGATMNPKDQPETPEETLAYQQMPMAEYLGTRLRQSLDPLNHWRQTLGLSLMGFGAAYTTAGVASGRYSEIAMGVILASGGGILSFEKDKAAAWRRMGALYFSTLTPLAATHAAEAWIYHNDPYIAGAVASWAMGNLTAVVALGNEENQDKTER